MEAHLDNVLVTLTQNVQCILTHPLPTGGPNEGAVCSVHECQIINWLHCTPLMCNFCVQKMHTYCTQQLPQYCTTHIMLNQGGTLKVFWVTLKVFWVNVHHNIGCPMEVQCAWVPNHKLAALRTADALQTAFLCKYCTLIAHCIFHNIAPPTLCWTDLNPLDCTALQLLLTADQISPNPLFHLTWLQLLQRRKYSNCSLTKEENQRQNHTQSVWPAPRCIENIQKFDRRVQKLQNLEAW